MSHRVLLNCLPPKAIGSPSLRLSVLKGFLERHGHAAEIRYWNLEAYQLMGSMNVSSDMRIQDVVQLVPYLAHHAHRLEDQATLTHLAQHLQVIKPVHRHLNDAYYGDLVASLPGRVDALFNTGLKATNFEDVLLFGFSAKLFQWIPGLILLDTLKQLHPDLPTVVGGFGTKVECDQFMQVCPDADYCVWGEGEYSLLMLCETLAQETPELNAIPRLMYRTPDGIQVSDARGEYADLQRQVSKLDYSDYFDQLVRAKKSVGGKVQVSVPIEPSRGCFWNRCKFCYLNTGYRFRTKSPQAIVDEIRYQVERHGILHIDFLGSELLNRDMAEFDHLLDLLVAFNGEMDNKLHFIAELIHEGFSSERVKKLRLAGFEDIQIGFEALTDPLLDKIQKKTSVADSLLFIKWAQTYGINVSVSNVLIGIPDETDDDINDSIDNLHYLRFYFSSQGFRLYPAPLTLTCASKYYSALSTEERAHYVNSHLHYPPDLLPGDSRFAFLHFAKRFRHRGWDMFEAILEDYVQKRQYTYQLKQLKANRYYDEYCNGILTQSITFDETEHWDLLTICNHQVLSFEQALKALHTVREQPLSHDALNEVITDLQEAHLLYANPDRSKLVSIIDTDRILQIDTLPAA